MTNAIQKRYSIRFAKSSFLIFLFLLSWEFSPWFADINTYLERQSLDFRHKNIPNFIVPSKDVVFLDIDDYSLDVLESQEGRWPWKRSTWDSLLNLISLGEPKVILFDMLFTERDLKNPEADQQLANTAGRISNISFALSFESILIEHPERIPASASSKFDIQIKNYLPSKNQFGTFSKPYDQLWNSIKNVHVVNSFKDSDGFFRRTPLFFNYDQITYPSLSLKGLMLYLDNPELNYQPNSLQLIAKTKTYSVPLDKFNQLSFNFYQQNFSKISIEKLYHINGKLISGEVDPDALDKYLKTLFKDKILLIGGSATGLQDLKVTPIHKDYPGALLHAVAISNTLEDHFLVKISKYWNILAALFFVMFIYLNFVYNQNLISRNLFPILGLISYFFISVYLFAVEQTDLNFVTPILFGFITYGDGISYMAFVEAKQKKKIAGTLSKYLSPHISQQLVDNGVDPTAEIGHKKELSILFSDVRDFTTMSEKIKPEQVVEMLNYYLAKMTHIVFKHQGTLDKFIGDAVMAFWGAPIPDPNAALNSVKAAFEMMTELKSINSHFMQKYGIAYQIGIGINTGDVIVGNIGSDQRLDYTVIGDNVNLASRLEGLTKNYKTDIIIGESTYSKIKDAFFCRTLDRVQVKGKTDSTRLFEVIAEKSYLLETQKNIATQYEEALELYLSGNFRQSHLIFKKLRDDHKDGPSYLMAERTDYLISNPPDQWNGVFKFTSK